ncbi:Hypothetical predicted protein [Pelobates cultripes]|uniref:Uncharacterized protein n=1 Tax=Pelobates cultripes TaxID=61616 RepID=A0AAD1VQ97_PELCU|nr:Hypothetical predicted protein [Pelobates cultripes]
MEKERHGTPRWRQCGALHQWSLSHEAPEERSRAAVQLTNLHNSQRKPSGEQTVNPEEGELSKVKARQPQAANKFANMPHNREGEALTIRMSNENLVILTKNCSPALPHQLSSTNPTRTFSHKRRLQDTSCHHRGTHNKRLVVSGIPPTALDPDH